MKSEKNFTEKDKENFVNFLNFVAQKATMNLNTSEIIKFFHLLSSMQKELLPKIDAHVFEIKRVIESKEE